MFINRKGKGNMLIGREAADKKVKHALATLLLIHNAHVSTMGGDMYIECDDPDCDENEICLSESSLDLPVEAEEENSYRIAMPEHTEVALSLIGD